MNLFYWFKMEAVVPIRHVLGVRLMMYHKSQMWKKLALDNLFKGNELWVQSDGFESFLPFRAAGLYQN